MRLTDSTPADVGPEAASRGGAGEVPDAALVRRLRAGEAAAGEVLVGRYAKPLTAYLRRLCGDEHLAEELHQAAWLSALEHLEKFDDAAEETSFKAWLFRIAANKANDHWRSKGRGKKAVEQLRLASEEYAPDAGHRAEAEGRAERLRAAVDKLPEPQKQVVLLRYYTGMKFVEIADLLGCPLNTALGRMHKAAAKLRKALADDE